MGIPFCLSFIFLLLIFTTHSVTSITTTNQIHQLRPHSGSSGFPIPTFDCTSWRLAVETDNIQEWKLVPKSCEAYIGHYMLGEQYREDCIMVAEAAYTYAKTLKLVGDGNDVWIFDIDETTLSNLPYYARSDVAFGSVPYNETSFDEWVAQGVAPPVPGALKLYERLVRLGFKIIFLTGTNEAFEKVRISNLKKVGYYKWEKLILKGNSEWGSSAIAYKSAKRTMLVESGYRIWGNMGDQWTDLLGDNVGNRTFKVPDPMYYIS
ncbi:hypothetical protein L1987_53800 [Smallanthus sonchifolius]|uniref:Uncharacterized protein n=1 Tax=Smallanthus sonchifolius TaxID=185202 RepID=A0ACB9EY36_9ASTR|nr:hypothetical protein L1987_53800 [Smallanthus sonchifolius]